MRSRLKDNGLYETSRMFMPEHREAWLAQCEQQKNVVSRNWMIRKFNGSVKYLLTLIIEVVRLI